MIQNGAILLDLYPNMWYDSRINKEYPTLRKVEADRRGKSFNDGFLRLFVLA